MDIDGVALLERALSYACGGLGEVTPARLTAPTPCAGWDLRFLLWHMTDSLDALAEGLGFGHVSLASGAPEHPREPIAAIRDRARRILCEVARAEGKSAVSVGGYSMEVNVLAGAGAIEVAVHGWDVAQACAWPNPIPSDLANELLPLASAFITGADRPGRFGAPIDVNASAGPQTRLLAFLGRPSS